MLNLHKFYDVIVVGGGPAGTTAARFAAEQGVSVLLLEKDRDIGYPVRCAEAVSTKSILEFIDIDQKWIKATINKFSLISPDKTEVVIGFDESGYILERKIFDYELGVIASKAGAQILTRAYVNGLVFCNDKVSGVTFEYEGEQHSVNAHIVIAADGVESRAGRWAGIKTFCDYRDMESCAQVTASNIPVNDDTCYFYFGKDVAPEGYLWVFPKGNQTANIGLGVSGKSGKEKSAKSYLEKFMSEEFPNAPILTKVAGGVPCAVTLDKITGDGIMIVGDAAHQVNPLSGGGITSGMIGGSIAGRIAGEAIKRKDMNHIYEYEREWQDKRGKKHLIYNKLKNGIYNFSDDKFNSLAHSFSKVAPEKRTLGKIFLKALVDNPMLSLEVAKVFLV